MQLFVSSSTRAEEQVRRDLDLIVIGHIIRWRISLRWRPEGEKIDSSRLRGGGVTQTGGQLKIAHQITMRNVGRPKNVQA